MQHWNTREEQEFFEGRYQGVGVDLRMEDGHALIVAPLDGSPAQEAGLRPGEIITKVDDKSLLGLDLIRIVKLILGVPGTRVRLSVLDPSSNAYREVTMTRTFVELNNVLWQLLPGTTIAHLRIAGFSRGVSAEAGGDPAPAGGFGQRRDRERGGDHRRRHQGRRQR